MHNLSTFIQEAKAKHGDKFDYSKTVYTTSETPTTIVCPIHGDTLQTPYNHTKSLYGCRKCGEAAAAAGKQKDLAYFIAKAKKIHGDKYDYSKTIYVAAKSKVTITCPDHGDFTQLVSGHLSGYGCKHCASHGKGRVDFTKPCTLYYLHLKDFGYYKVGITALPITNRYRTKFDLEQFDIVFTKTFTTGKEAYTIEQELLKQYSSLKYTGDKILKSGNTEIFTEDIFKGNYSEYIT